MKPQRLTTTALLFFFSSLWIHASDFPVSDLDIYRTMKRSEIQNTKKMSPEQKIDAAQAYLIKNIFLKSMLDPKSMLMMGDDEEEQSYGITQQEMSLYNEIIADEMAKQLAKQDMLKLKKIYLKKYQAESKAQPENQKNIKS